MLQGPKAWAIVHDEVIRTEEPEEGWRSAIDGAASMSRGNIPHTNFGGGIRVDRIELPPQGSARETGPFHRPLTGTDRLAVALKGSFSRYSGVLYAKKLFSYGRWSHLWTDSLGTDAFAQLEYDELLHLQLRAIVGVGVRWEALQGPAFEVALGTGYMAEHERLACPDDIACGDLSLTEFAHRWSNYVGVQVQVVEKKLFVKNTFYIQPRFGRFSDFRALDVIELLARVDESLSLSVIYDVHYDSEPAFVDTGSDKELRTTDIRLRTVLRWVF